MKRVLELINKYWGALLVLGGIFSTVITFMWNLLVIPQIDSHIDSRVMKMANDSLGLMIDNHMVSKGGGFRGGLSDSTGIKKEAIIDTLSNQILGEVKIKADIRKNQEALSYQDGYNFFILKQIATKDAYDGVTFWLPPDGNVYYRDMYGLLWDAKYDSYDDCYYFYPSYGNGNRLKCE